MGLANGQSKISREFSRRLDGLKPGDRVRAIVMLRADGNGGGGAGGRRPSSADRRDTAEKISQAAEAALPEIDQILERYDGRRMAEHPNAIGAIPVEATGGGGIAPGDPHLCTAISEDHTNPPLPTE